MPIIKHIDIIQPGDPLKLMKKSLKEAQVLVNELAKSNKQLSQALQLVKKAGTGTEAKQLNDLTNQLEKSTNKLTLSMTDQAKKLEVVKVEQLRVNKVRKEAATLANKNISLYQKESIKLNNLRKSYKDLALQNKQNTTEGKKMLANLRKLDAQLKKVDASVGQNQRKVGSYSQSMKNFAKQMFLAGGIIGAFMALGRVLKGAFKIMADFSKAASGLAAILQKTKKEIKVLTEQAKELGRTTAFTAAEVIKLQTELARLGFSIKEIGDATPAILDLAAALGIDLADAAMVSGGIVRAFGLSTKDTKEVVDSMVATLNNSGAAFEDYREAVKLSAPIFKAANIDFKTMNLLIGNLADSQIKGSIAGTGLKNLISKLSNENSKLSKELGFSVKNSDDLVRAFEVLKTKNIDLTEATELTDERSKAAFLTLIQGVDSADKLSVALNNLNDNAKITAKTMLDNVAGDFKLAESAYQGLVQSIADGEGPISSAMRGIVQSVTDMLTALTDFNDGGFLTKLKVIANALATATGVGAKYRFETERTAGALKLSTIDHKENTRQVKKEDEVIIKLTEAQKKANTERAEENRIRAQRAKDIIPVLNNEVEAVKTVGEVRIQTEKEIQANLTAIALEGIQTRFNFDLDNAKLFMQEIEDAKLEIQEQAITSGQQLASDIFSSFQDEKLAKLNSDSEAEKKILQERLDKGVISEEQFAKEVTEIDKKQRIASAKAEKKKAIFDIGISTLVAVIKTFANLGFPFGIPAAIAVAGVGAIQAAAVLATPIPKLEKGEINIDAPSHAQGGKLVEIEGGESYVNKEATSKSTGILNMVQDGILTDKSFSQMSREDTNMLLAGLLVQGNQKGDKMIHLLGKLGLVIPRGNENWIERANGNIERASKINLGNG